MSSLQNSVRTKTQFVKLFIERLLNERCLLRRVCLEEFSLLTRAPKSSTTPKERQQRVLSLNEPRQLIRANKEANNDEYNLKGEKLIRLHIIIIIWANDLAGLISKSPIWQLPNAPDLHCGISSPKFTVRIDLIRWCSQQTDRWTPSSCWFSRWILFTFHRTPPPALVFAR